MADKIYINGAFIKEQQVGDMTILKVNIPENALVGMFKTMKANIDNGWVRLVIKRSKEPKLSKTTGKVTSTHYLMVDDWKPGEQKPKAQWPSGPTPAQKAEAKQEATDDVPF